MASMEVAGFKAGDRVVIVPAPEPPKALNCRCGAPIVMLQAPHGRLMWPVDADTVEDGDTVVDIDKHRSHYVTCKVAETTAPEYQRGE